MHADEMKGPIYQTTSQGRPEDVQCQHWSGQRGQDAPKHRDTLIKRNTFKADAGSRGCVK